MQNRAWTIDHWRELERPIADGVSATGIHSRLIEVARCDFGEILRRTSRLRMQVDLVGRLRGSLKMSSRSKEA